MCKLLYTFMLKQAQNQNLFATRTSEPLINVIVAVVASSGNESWNVLDLGSRNT